MRVRANGLLLEVEDHGPPSGPALLLIMGLGMQLVGWPDGLVALLVRRGFRVVRFDNRDIGLSQGFDRAGVPNLPAVAMRHALGLRIDSAYTLSDMAADSLGILDALGIESAHVCGASMGGMIAQRLALTAPRRVRSLTLMMTSSGSRRLPAPSLKVRAALMARPRDARSLDGIVEHYVGLYDLIGSPGYPTPRDELRARFRRHIQRSHRPAGTARQMVAIAADGDRSPLLAGLRVPTHVIHGAVDPLVPVAAGHDLARRIQGATLDVIDGMAHDLPTALWPRFAAGIEVLASRATSA
jgi:pimeloyl-ACP methyl ester carboxylesterase